MQITLRENKLTPRRKIKLKETTLDNKHKLSRNVETIDKEDNKTFKKFPPVLFPYQKKFFKKLDDPKKQVYVYLKSRRIGLSWCCAAYAVLEASKKNAKNFYYVTINITLAREFVDSAKFWAKHFNLAANAIEEFLYKDEDKDILALRINFASGKKVMALSSKPSSVRGLQGWIAIDECAALPDLEDFLKAVNAMIIWKCKVILISTITTVDNPFTVLVEKVKKGELPYDLSVTDFRTAVKEGLFKRICLVSGDKWSPELEKQWIEDTYKFYGSGSLQELDCIPLESSPNAIFRKEFFRILEPEDVPTSFDYLIWAIDFAASEKTYSCYTVATLLGKFQDNYCIVDWRYCQYDALKTQKFIIEVVKTTNQTVPVYIELEGGSQSLLWFDNSFKPSLPGYKIIGCRPEGSKMGRAIPVADAAEKGKIFLKKAKWNDTFLDTIKQFEGIPGVPLITDTGDSLSLAYAEINKGLKGTIGGTVKPQNKNQRFGNGKRI